MGGRVFKKVNDARKTPGAEEWISIPEQQLAELNFLKTTRPLIGREFRLLINM